MDRLTMTAMGMAAIRAAESSRADRLFDDPYAQLFLNALPGVLARQFTAGPKSLGAMFAAHGAIRTRFFDDYLVGSACHQVVLLAAGLDTRAFRLDWPQPVRLYELDLPDVFATKETVLAEHEPRCERVTLPVDLRGHWQVSLVEAGFNPASPTAWLAEGLLIYLSAAETIDLLTTVSELSAGGSTLAFEHSTDGRLVAQASATPSMAEFTKMWKSSPDQDLVGWLGAHGWRAEVHGDVNYGRTGFSGEFVTAQFTPTPD
jgi:methyltransferase (TIGR00027 family)